ncbi:MAG: DNA mismatch repair protein MutS, partial [Cyclobacteriaceae bacterium]|nr:DNA mismatch repair protein MutS [Cyclobacteriaceae bacterium]
GFVLKQNAKVAEQIYEQTYDGLKEIMVIKNLILAIQNKTFTSEKLLFLQAPFSGQGVNASHRLAKLSGLLEYFHARANAFYHIFNLFFFLDIHLIRALESWKSKNADYVSEWFDKVSEMEAINSLAGFHHANPSYQFPAISEEGHSFEATALGHPLIAQEKRICNDAKLEGKGQVYIVTGSNMSGKSTFLRTVGINTVMAYAGAPVCASAMNLSLFNLFSCMRTIDDLSESISSFYAELKRIRQLLDYAENSTTPVFFMIDEVLKGTNSDDRHKGAKALALQLSEMNVFGLISTHDITLGALEEKGEKFRNLNFDSRLEGNEIIFDYKLKEGICQSFNASWLMKKMGIKVE